MSELIADLQKLINDFREVFIPKVFIPSVKWFSGFIAEQWQRVRLELSESSLVKLIIIILVVYFFRWFLGWIISALQYILRMFCWVLTACIVAKVVLSLSSEMKFPDSSYDFENLKQSMFSIWTWLKNYIAGR